MKSSSTNTLMKRTLDADEDIRAEAAALAARGGHSAGDGAAASQLPGDGGHAREPMEEAVAHPFVVHQLNWRPGGHRPNAATLSMLDEIGGIDGLQSFTARFYSKAFQDPTLDPLIRDRADPHGSRFANWIAEKFGHRDEPWTTERSTRATCPFASHGYSFTTPHDRSSAHYAAWHSPKRDGGRFGEHFKLDDCRVWMRLHFWALRDAGLDARSPSPGRHHPSSDCPTAFSFSFLPCVTSWRAGSRRAAASYPVSAFGMSPCHIDTRFAVSFELQSTRAVGHCAVGGATALGRSSNRTEG